MYIVTMRSYRAPRSGDQSQMRTPEKLYGCVLPPNRNSREASLFSEGGAEMGANNRVKVYPSGAAQSGRSKTRDSRDSTSSHQLFSPTSTPLIIHPPTCPIRIAYFKSNDPTTSSAYTFWCKRKALYLKGPKWQHQRRLHDRANLPKATRKQQLSSS